MDTAEVSASGANIDTAAEKKDVVVSGDIEALGEEARAVDAQLHARVLRKIDLVLMPAMVIGVFASFDNILIKINMLQVMDWFTGIRSVANYEFYMSKWVRLTLWLLFRQF